LIAVLRKGRRSIRHSHDPRSNVIDSRKQHILKNILSKELQPKPEEEQ
jgi:hypothetical protein